VTGRWLIINADDAGLAPEVDAGILEAARAGTVTSASLCVNPPHAPAVAALRAAGVSLGLHATFTQGMPCAPAARVPTLVDAEGRFFLDGRERLAAFSAADIETELAAQAARFEALVGAPPTHLDFHRHLHARDARVLAAAEALAAALRIPLRAVSAGMRAACRAAGVAAADHFLGGVAPAPYWTRERLRAAIADLPEGITELMCHPAKGMRPAPGIRYCAERDVEREALLSAEVRRCCAAAALANFATVPFASAAGR
jgi:hypothetical protein